MTSCYRSPHFGSRSVYAWEAALPIDIPIEKKECYTFCYRQVLEIDRADYFRHI